MAGFCDYLELLVLAHVVGKTAYSMPTVYVALSTTTPSDAGGNITEPSGNGYARQLTTGVWGTASGGQITNSSAVTFPTATGAGWGTVTHFVLYDAVSGGNALLWGALTPSKLISAGDTPSFGTGALVVTLD